MTGYGENMTPEQEPAVAPPDETKLTKYRAAGFWIRLLAFLIDLMVIAGLNAIIWGSLLPIATQPSFLYQVLHTNILFLGLTGAAYFILMTRYFQQTLGKMIVGIKVVQRSGEPLSWITVIFRELVARSLSQIMGLYLGYMVCWFNAEKRCAHDFLSDTWVVYENPMGDSHCILIETGQVT
ncbi:MAG: RDD family protein [Firmicutes bacterium HGW-Firmicutes-15]|nr:MAG: RDD family protein [Firmicutes bacterium HGW-Firmicutes-15]